MSYERKITSDDLPVFLAIGGLLVFGGIGYALYDSYESEKPATVVEGANGKYYAIPDDARRAVYSSRDDCIADVNEQKNTIIEADEEVTETAEDLCEPVDEYRSHSGGTTIITHSQGSYYGPIVNEKGRWTSNRIISWETSIPNRTFAIPGGVVQKDLQEAEKGQKPGQKTVTRGGFGVSPKGGFLKGAAS